MKKDGRKTAGFDTAWKNEKERLIQRTESYKTFTNVNSLYGTHTIEFSYDVVLAFIVQII